MDIEEIRKTIDEINELVQPCDNSFKIYRENKRLEIETICLLCELREDNSTINFNPWINALEKIKDEDPPRYKIILEWDKIIALPHVFVSSFGNIRNLHQSLEGHTDDDYEKVKNQFIDCLNKLHSASKNPDIDHELNGSWGSIHRIYESMWRERKYREEGVPRPLPLPSTIDIENVAKIFGKIF